MLEALGYAHNKKEFTVAVRGVPVTTVPDIVDHERGIIGEIKDTAVLRWTSQLEAQYFEAQKRGYRYILYTRNDTTLLGDLAADIHSGKIDHDYIDNYIVRETD